jgi:type I site-specific restriction-modification system R (restriction) subunit
LRTALERLNPELSSEAINLAIEELTRDRSTMSAAAANREVYHLLKNGVQVPVRGGESGGRGYRGKAMIVDYTKSFNDLSRSTTKVPRMWMCSLPSS